MTDANQDPFSNVLETLYGGLLEGVPWEAFLRALAQWLEGSYATLILTAPGLSAPGAMVTPGGNPKTNEDYLTTHFASDPFQGLPEGQVTSFKEFLQGQTSQEISDYMDFLDAAGGDQVLGVDLRLPSGFEARCRVTRDRSRPDFSADDRVRFQSLVPHLRNAARLFERLQIEGAEHGVYRGAVEQLGVGTIILDQTGTITRTNAVADQLLAAGDGMRSSDGRLTLGDRQHQKTIESLLTRMGDIPDPVRFKLCRTKGRDLAVVARPIQVPAILRRGANLALFISVPGDDAQLDPAAIRDLFQLTRMEATLAVSLASGRSLVDAADTLGIAHNTARAHLRSIFAKTGARRQSQLVHLLRSGLQ